MVGVGTPVASHNNCMSESSRTIWSRLTLVRFAATEKSMYLRYFRGNFRGCNWSPFESNSSTSSTSDLVRVKDQVRVK